MEETRRAAEAGDGLAMSNLALLYRNGQRGLEQDYAKCFEWASKSHRAGCASGTRILGICYLDGHGVEQHVAFGVQLNTLAAERGSAGACCILGDLFVGGIDLPQNLDEARYWFSKVPSCAIKDLSQAGRDRAATWLREHPA